MYRLFNLEKDPLESIKMESENWVEFQKIRKRLSHFLNEETTPLKPYDKVTKNKGDKAPKKGSPKEIIEFDR